MENRYIGTLIGCALGDTLGMPVEIWKREQIRKYFGRITEPVEPKVITLDGKEIAEDEFGKLKYWFRGLSKGDYTDDTILTLAVAKSLVAKGFDLNDVAKGQLNAYVTRQRDDGGHNGGFGGTTREACERLKAGISPLESGVIGGPGNAPPMKMSSVGLYMHARKVYNEGLYFAEKVGKITHLDPRSTAGGVVQAHAIYSLLNNISRSDFVDSLVDVCEKYEKPLNERFTWHDKGNLQSKLRWVRVNMNANVEEAYQKIGVSSAVYKSYPFTLFMFQKHWENPVLGLIETVNQGGDCDTTGAMYGALAGAKAGLEIFPQKWITTIKDREEIIALGKELYNLGGGNV